MTEPKLIAPSTQFDAGAIEMIRTLMDRAGDLEKLASMLEKVAPEGETESLRTVGRRVAVALADRSDKRPAYQKIEEAGCPVEMFAQLAEDPLWIDDLKRQIARLNLIPRLPSIINSATNRAIDGDTRALSFIERVMRLSESEKTVDEFAQAYGKMDVAGLREEIAGTIESLQEIAQDIRPMDEIAEAVKTARAAVKRVDTEEKPVALDHRRMNSE